MAHVVCGSEKMIWLCEVAAIRAVLSDKEQDLVIATLMMDVPLAGV